MKKVLTVLIILVVLLVIVLMIGPFYVLEEGYQSVVTRFGAIVNSTPNAGLHFKTPLIDTVIRYPKKILSWDGSSQRIPTQENQFIWVDTTARWKIIDPLKFYESVNRIQNAYGRLDEVIDSAVRTVIADNPLHEAVRNSNVINEIDRSTPLPIEGEEVTNGEGLGDLSQLILTDLTYDEVVKGREILSDEMFLAASRLTPQYGIELIDIIVRQIRYSDDLTQSVYNRMIKDRNRIAEAYRSYGEGKKLDLLGQLENKKKSILSGAYEQAETIRGKADAQATRIYNEAYEIDPTFFEFWRSVESYRKVLPKFRKTLTTDMEYFKYLYSQDGR